jgi:hypothetical protein
MTMTISPSSDANTDRSRPRQKLAQTGDTVSSKEEYRAFCSREASIPLFARDWWLDAAVGYDGWDVAVVRKSNEIVASMPYVLRTRLGMRIVTQPALTPILGPWLRQSEGKPAAQLSNENELMQSLIDQLPPFDHFTQTWHSSVSNWQPFFWNGFQQTTYYTYVLPDLSDTERLWADLDSRVRRTINKAERGQVQIRDDLPLNVFLDLNRKTFERQGLFPPYSDEFVRRLDAACEKRGCRKLMVAVDSAGVPVSGEYFVWDEHSGYRLLSGTDPSNRQSGAGSLCLWTMIRHAASVTHRYNLCGSMIKPVEAYLRLFGGKQVSYFRVSKTPSRLLTLRQGFLSLIGAK